MKAKFTYLLVLSALFIACSEKDLYEPTAGGNKDVTELVIPSDFDWSMTNEVSCAFTAASATPIEVYTDKSCKDNSLIAEYTLVPDQENVLLAVPSYITTLYVKANGSSSYEEVAVNNGVATYNAPPTSRANDGLPGDYDEEEDKKGKGWIYYPSKEGWATVMFEDYFPIKGDYDFNDFVANYRSVATISKQSSHVISMTFEVKVRALGGMFPYEAYLKLHGMKLGDVGGGFVGDGVELISSANNDVRVRIADYATPPAGAKYLNTDPEEAKVPVADLRTVTFTVGANNDKGTGVSQKHIKIDFYLKGKGHGNAEYEIHQRGFEAIEKGLYPSTGLGSVPYTTTDNFVWGITVPGNISHAIEAENFLKAYPEFASWAESGGVSHTDWYKNAVSDYLFPME